MTRGEPEILRTSLAFLCAAAARGIESRPSFCGGGFAPALITLVPCAANSAESPEKACHPTLLFIHAFHYIGKTGLSNLVFMVFCSPRGCPNKGCSVWKRPFLLTTIIADIIQGRLTTSTTSSSFPCSSRGLSRLICALLYSLPWV